ncbi:prepilin-type N-terminal cleavage/methylation domain-containing protein [Ureibacillus thermosphaericus]|nr:prepilin-type N-terminal cleavage/methylation domain-containing protein [Ureibacillus thermosphaericus]
MKKRLKNEKGLTLVELLAVIVILAIVAMIAVPAIGNIIDNSRYKAAKADAIMILEAANIYFTDNPSKTEVAIKELNESGYVENLGTFKRESGGKVNNGKPLTLNGTATISGEKTVKFTNATIEKISEDERSAKEAFNGGTSAEISGS